MTDQQEKESVKTAFRRIVHLRRLLALLLATYIPVVCLFYFFQIDLWLFVTICAAWICAAIVVAFMIGYSVCPICRQYFHVRGLEGKTFTKVCLNCGIRLNTGS